MKPLIKIAGIAFLFSALGRAGQKIIELSETDIREIQNQVTEPKSIPGIVYAFWG